MYKIIDNAGNLHKKEFTGKQNAIAYMKEHWKGFIVSILRSDRITLVDQENYIIWEVDPATGKEYIKWGVKNEKTRWFKQLQRDQTR